MNIIIEHGADANEEIQYKQSLEKAFERFENEIILNEIENNDLNETEINFNEKNNLEDNEDNEKIIEMEIDMEIDESSLFINACRKNNENLIKYLIEHGMNVNMEIKDPQGNSSMPIFYGCHNIKIVRYLVEYTGADVNTKLITEKGYTSTILSYTCKMGYTKLFKYLVKHGANIKDLIENEHGVFSILGYSCYCKQDHITNYLIKIGETLSEHDINNKEIFISCPREPKRGYRKIDCKSRCYV